jgi:hypothetical protein
MIYPSIEEGRFITFYNFIGVIVKISLNKKDFFPNGAIILQFSIKGKISGKGTFLIFLNISHVFLHCFDQTP